MKRQSYSIELLPDFRECCRPAVRILVKSAMDSWQPVGIRL